MKNAEGKTSLRRLQGKQFSDRNDLILIGISFSRVGNVCGYYKRTNGHHLTHKHWFNDQEKKDFNPWTIRQYLQVFMNRRDIDELLETITPSGLSKKEKLSNWKRFRKEINSFVYYSKDQRGNNGYWSFENESLLHHGVVITCFAYTPLSFVMDEEIRGIDVSNEKQMLSLISQLTYDGYDDKEIHDAELEWLVIGNEYA